ncbi:MAG: hypothetical protein AB202_02665 [Parcubacteria bacterium C7867-007]|nr:MAG: hypothetical protein AB202_02665 [Parcubacteria bacterium C7867-007]
MDIKTNTKIVISAVVGIILGAGGVMAFSQKNEIAMPSISGDAVVGHNTQQDPMMSSLAGKKGESFDREFIIQMIAHHQGAIQMAEMALETSKRPEIKELSTEIIAAQKMEIQKMQEWHLAWFGSSVPVTPTGQ